MKNFLTLILFVLISVQAKAQDMKIIKVVIPYSAGSSFEHIFRTLQIYGVKHNINFIPEFKPGANGLIGAEYASKQTTDGSVLMIAGISDLTNMSSIKQVDYTNFIPVSALCKSPLYLVANKNITANNLTSLIDMIKKDSQSVTFATQSLKSKSLFKEISSTININHEELRLIPFNNTAQATTSIASGFVDVGLFQMGVVKSLLDSNRIKLLAKLEEDGNTDVEHILDKSNNIDGIGIFLPRGATMEIVKFWQDFMDNFKQDDQAKTNLSERYFQTFKGKGPKDIDNIIKNQIKKLDKFGLTFRQQQVARLIINRGLSIEQVADTLNLSEATVKLHAGLVYKKYGVTNKTQLIALSKNNFG